MRMFNLADGQSLQFGDISVTVLDVGEDEVLLRIDCPEGVKVEAGNSDLVLQSEMWLE
jgi:sRNA-binding carbon storage regulator CsrA